MRGWTSSRIAIFRTFMRDPIETHGSFWPQVIVQESRGERVYDLPSRLLRERIIFITGAIDEKHTGQSLKAVEHALERDNFFTADAAREFGLIDKVIEKRPMPVESK